MFVVAPPIIVTVPMVSECPFRSEHRVREECDWNSGDLAVLIVTNNCR